jgi:starch synthase
MVPGYPAITAAIKSGEAVHRFANLFGGPATLMAGRVGRLDLIAVNAPHLFERPGNPYAGKNGKDWPDNALRFAALSVAAAEIGRGRVAAFRPDIVHCHDWHSSLAAAYLHFADGARARTVLTVHNLAFQGVFPFATFADLALPEAASTVAGLEYYGQISFLKGGLQYADAVTTVSPTYAREIATPGGGMGLDGVIRDRRDVLHGVLNGVDTEIWNPKADANLAATYDESHLQRRQKNKRAIEAKFGLANADGILFGIVSRLTRQKGIDLVVECMDAAVAAGARFAILGSGERDLEEMLKAAAARHEGRVGVVIGYDEELSHLLQGGADAVVVPSRFEPCGLTQFYGLRYGCVPVVARVGGLADSIIDANDAGLAAKVATGLQFLPVDRDGLMAALERTMVLFRDEPTWSGLQRRGMKTDVSWDRSAAAYAKLYRTLM